MSDERLREAPASRFDAEALVFDLNAELTALRAEGPPKHGHRQKTLFKHAGRTIALFAIEGGGGLPDHKTAGTVSVQAVEGEVNVAAGSTDHRLREGQVLVIAPNVRHSVAAEHPAAFLLQVSLLSP